MVDDASERGVRGRKARRPRSDEETTRHQADELLRVAHGGDADRRLVELVRDRRRAGAVDRPDVVQFSLGGAGGRRPVPLVDGELLVRSDVPHHVLDAVASMMDAAPEEVDDLPGLIRFRNPKIAVSQLESLARTIRGWHHQASVAHVTPLRILLKGESGPERPASAVPARPADAPHHEAPVVAVVDSGISAATRTDRWIEVSATEGLGGGVDPLDEFPLGAPDGRLDLAAGHGTFVVGVVRQVDPTVRVVSYRALDGDGVGSEVDVAQGMVRVVRDQGADVINLSLGVQTVDDQPLLAVLVAIETIRKMKPGVVVVAAAGNYGDTAPCFPAAQDGVVGVAALRADLTLAPWSSRGHWVQCAAVGEGIVAPFVPGEESPLLDQHPDVWSGPDPWAVWSGSSFAAPQVAAAIAATMARDGVDAPTALRTVLDSGRPLPDAGRALALLPGTARA